MTIRRRLVSGLLVSAALVGAVGIVALVNCRVIDREIRLVKQGSAISVDILEIRRQEKNYFIFREDVYLQRIEEKMKALNDHIAERKSEIGNRYILDALSRIGSGLEEYEGLFSEVVKEHRNEEEIIRRMRFSGRAVEKAAQGKRKAEEIIAAFLQARRQEKNYQIYRDKFLVPGEKSYNEGFQDAIGAIKNAAGDDREIISLTRRYAGNFQDLVENNRKTDQLVGQLREQGRVVESLITEITEGAWASIGNALKNTMKGMIIVFLVAIVMAVGLGLHISRKVTKPLDYLVTATQKISKGDLSVEAKVRNGDEIDYLADSFNIMVQNLKKSRDEIKENNRALEDANRILQEQNEKMKMMQVGLIQSEKLAAIGELTSGVAHEINNPLGVVLGYTQLLLNSEVNEETKGDLKIIEDNIRRCQRIVGNMLTFGRKHKPEKELVNINEVVEKTLALREYEMTLDNIAVIRELGQEIPQVLADPYQMQQIFLNLINNACDSMKEKQGEKKLTIMSELDGSVVRVKFSDTGRGIPTDNLKKVFDPFFTTKKKGAGLGLSVSYGIIQEHRGRIYAESKEGEGTVFFVELPIKSGPNSQRIAI